MREFWPGRGPCLGHLRARVIHRSRAVHDDDLRGVKPADTATLIAAAAATGGRLVVAEDHHPEGGLGSAVLDALTGTGRTDLAVAHLAVREMPGSGTPAELLGASGIDAAHIAEAARRLLADE